MGPVSTNDLSRLHVSGDGVDSVRRSGVFAGYGGHGANQGTATETAIYPQLDPLPCWRQSVRFVDPGRVRGQSDPGFVTASSK